jgi:tRNA-binding protein
MVYSFVKKGKVPQCENVINMEVWNKFLTQIFIFITSSHFHITLNRNKLYMISWDDFEKIDMRAGTIVEVNDFPKARKPAYKLVVDFGNEIGLKRSSAQITTFYTREELLNRQVIAVVNFPSKQIADFVSECLVLGVYDENKNVILLQPGKPVTNGMKVG